MARKLKTYITAIGFFELAVAAPSMKAALDAWGVARNLFQDGFAQETGDPRIVAAAMARPGVVLRRAVGSKGAFTENAALPRNLPAAAPPQPAAKPKPPKPQRRAAPADDTRQKAAIIQFEKEKARRETERAQQQAEREKEQEREAREDGKRRKAADKAQAVLQRAKECHETNMTSIEQQRQALEDKAAAERDRWRQEKTKLEQALRDAEN